MSSIDIFKIADELTLFDEKHQQGACGCACGRSYPSVSILADILEDLKAILFPHHLSTLDVRDTSVSDFVKGRMLSIKPLIQEQIHRELCVRVSEDTTETCQERSKRSEQLTLGFLASLPHVRRMLQTDVQAAYDGDPAATSTHETILCYPGLLAILHYRLAHELHSKDLVLISRMISERAHSITGIDIHPRAEISERFFIDHGTGVVIGATSVIGKNVRLYQGVTLGAKSFPLDENGKPIKGIARHPIVEDDVIIYSEATILGRITIGKGSVIGGNVWLTHSVPPESRIAQVAAKETMYSFGGGI